MESETWTVTETARLLGISRNKAYQEIQNKNIPVLKLGKRLLVPKKALEQLLEVEVPKAER